MGKNNQIVLIIFSHALEIHKATKQVGNVKKPLSGTDK
jgi:hypothetical protein